MNSETVEELTGRIRHLLAEVRRQIGVDIVYLSRFADGDQQVLVVEGTHPELHLAEGDRCPLEDTYCYRLVHGLIPSVLLRPSEDARVAHLPGTAQCGIGTYLGVPVHIGDGRVYGILCAASHEPRSELTAADVRVLELLSGLIAGEVRRLEAGIARTNGELEELHRFISGGGIEPFLQPIVRLSTGETVAHEALSRFTSNLNHDAGYWFEQAHLVGVAAELDLAAARIALEATGRDRVGWLTVNMSPATLVLPEAEELLTRRWGRRVAVEVTERAVVEDYRGLRSAISRLRRAGVMLAIDDAGAGQSSLQHILSLRPDAIKLDSFLTRDIDRDAARAALSDALVKFAAEIDARVIAEGIESRSELDRLVELGFDYGQGYLLGRPAPVAA